LGGGVGFKARFLDLVGRTNFSLVTERLESWEYLALLKPPGDCWSIKFGHKKTLGSDTVFKFSVNFDFGGN
jgi:LPS-assembly protein